jgi:cell wall assembly regulator SMI1
VSIEQIDRAWEQIEAWLAGHAPKLARNLPPGATEAELSACEEAIGLSLPAELRHSLARHGGDSERAAPKIVGNWALMDSEYILREHRLMKRLLDAGSLDGESIPHPRITSLWWSPAWIPIVSSGSGHQICIDTAPPDGGVPGQVILFLHDDLERFVLADSFAAWWSAIARGLTDGSLAWDAAKQSFADEAFLSIALEGQHYYRKR